MRKIVELKPLTRVEGHGSVRVYRNGRRTEKVELALCESPRLFEALLLGKGYAELPEIICRICSICTTVHRLTSLAAIEQAFGIVVSEQTRLYRELILHGGHMASHALHLFCLVLPDHYGVDGFAGLARTAPEDLRLGLCLKAAANQIQETVGGRLIHPVTLIPGIMGHRLQRNQLLGLRDALAPLVDETQKVWGMFTPVSPHTPASSSPCYLAVDGEGGLLAGSRLKLANGKEVRVQDYRQVLQEQYLGYSNAKQSTTSGTIVTVGALARLNLNTMPAAMRLPEYDTVRQQLLGAHIQYNSLAQAIELFSSLSRAIQLIDQILNGEFDREEPPVIIPRQAAGCAAMEAPRGTLIHYYRFDSRGVCTGADIITPTAINQAAMERDLQIAARDLDGADDKELGRQLEVIVRAYDPCISCAVHFVTT